MPRSDAGGGRPRIGVTTLWQPVSFGAWHDVPSCLVPQTYVEAVRRAGGCPILVAPGPELVDDPALVIDVLDGLLLIGGEDISPERYGTRREPTSGPANGLRDDVELALLETALERELAVLGICRGAQLLNVAHGGDLTQDLGAANARHRARVGTFSRHEVEIEGGKVLDTLGRHAEVTSHHHQAPHRVGTGLTVTACAEDGTVEAIEDPARPFCVGVLWHAEEDGAAALFEAFVAAARDRATERAGV